MFKLTIIAALVAASFSSATAQTVQVNELIYVGKKCPDCQELTKWQYSRKGFVEILKSPDFNAYVKIVSAKGKNVKLRPFGGDSNEFVTQLSARAGQ